MSADHMFTGKRGEYIIRENNERLWNNQLGDEVVTTHTLTTGDIYKIVHDNLEYCRIMVNGRKEPLENNIDIDAMCQNVCVDIEKKLGIFPNIEKNRDNCEQLLGPATGETQKPETKP